MNIEFFEKIDQTIQNEIIREFEQFSLEKIQFNGDVRPFYFLLKDDSNNLIGAVTGNTFYHGLYIKELIVKKDFRNKGLGQELMEKAFEFGKNFKCTFCYLETMDYHGAVNFYENLGFRTDFIRVGYSKNSKMIYMTKKLEGSTSNKGA